MVTWYKRSLVLREEMIPSILIYAKNKMARMCSSVVFKWTPYGTQGVWHDNCYDYAFDLNNPRSTNKNVPGDMSNDKAWGLTFRTCDGIAKRVLEDYKGLAYQIPRATTPCRAGYYKVMNFVSPNGGDFHWYREARRVEYRIRPGDTAQSIAKFFRVPQTTVKAAYTKAHRARSASNGRIAMTTQELRTLNHLNEMVKTGRLRPGKVISLPIKLWSHKQGFGGGPVIVDASGNTIKNPLTANRNYPGLNYSKFCSAYCVKCRAGRTALARSRVRARAQTRMTPRLAF